MNMFKRMASIVLMAIMVLQIAAFAAPVPEDVIGTEYEAAASMLCALNIMVGDGNNFNPDDDITRAEFAQIMMKSLALDSAAEAYQPTGIFTDVATSNIFAPAIELGVGIGAIKGYGDGTFGPDDNVLGTEAVKMMTFAAGHDVTAEANGGYPSGYMSNALEIGMLKGISSLDFSAPMTRGQAAVLCANTLKVDMKKKVSEGGKIIYVENKDVNLLSEKHSVYKAEGIVIANDVTSLVQSSSLREGRVQIEYGAVNGIYVEGETTISDALGKYVRAYYKYDDDIDESTIVSYEVLDNKNDIQTTALSNVDFTTVTNTFVEYWKDKENDSRTTEVDISSSPYIIYNGTARVINTTVAETFAEIEGREGEVTFIDYNADGDVDVLNITAYETIVVDRIDAKDHIFTDKIGTYNAAGTSSVKRIQIDIDSANVSAEFVDIDDEPIEFDDISIDDVLSIAISDAGAGRQFANVKVSQESVDGEITEMGKKDGKYTFGIDGEKYEITDSYFDYITRGQGMSAAAGSLRVKVGTSGEFYLDAFGRIAYDKVSGVSEDATFGFLRKSAVGRGADDSLQLRIYSDGAYADYMVASKAVVDGLTCKGSAAVQAALGQAITYIEQNTTYTTGAGATLATINGYYDGYTGMTPMLFELDSDGKVKTIDTPYMRSGVESEYSLQPVKDQTLKFMQNVTYMKGTSTLSGTKYAVTASTPIITIPGNYSELDTEKKLSQIKPDKLTTDKTGTPYMQLFTTDPTSYKVEYALAKTNAGSEAPDGATQTHDLQMLIVSEVTQCLNNEGEKTISISGLQEGAQKEFIVDPDYFTSGEMYKAIWTNGTAGYTVSASDERKANVVLPGDAIRVFANKDGEISWAKATYLVDAKIFRSDDQGGTDQIDRYRAFDIAVVNQLEGNDARMRYLIGKKSSNNNGAGTTMLNINSDGYVIGAASANSSRTEDRNMVLYDEATKSYLFNTDAELNHMTSDETYDPSKFKIMVYDASRSSGDEVYSGTVSDLYDTTSTSEPASLVIMQFRGGSEGPTNPRGMYIIKY